MGRFIGPKAKICKRFEANIFGSPKFDRILAKMPKKRRMKRPSDYGNQLKEKQIARFTYGLSEKQFSKYYKMAYNSKEVTGETLLRVLETRLDNLIYRAGLASTRSQARQMVGHGHFEMKGYKVTVPSILVKAGDVITLRKKMQSSPLYVGFGETDSMKWMEVDKKAKSITVGRLPEADELEKTINVQLIVEYYSR
ncbi:30S ribosomal protein S4 [Candidatus Peregrinibacteria bacterium]|nr:MAG: 30S ribosomal protein S4 [Candidatus Peregrinibacteria bacterium]